MTSAATKGNNKSACATTTKGNASNEQMAKYIKDMPAKIEAMISQCNSQDYSALQIAARQLKESAGAYGCSQIIPCAEKLETIAKAGQPTEQIRKTIEEISTICKKMQSSKC